MTQRAWHRSSKRIAAMVCIAVLPIVVFAWSPFDEGEPLLLAPVSAAAAASQAVAAAPAAGGLPSAHREALATVVGAQPLHAAAAGEVVRGRVVDETGRGLVGVVVGGDGQPLPDAIIATSGHDGAFALPIPPAVSRLVALDPRWETVQAARPSRAELVTIVVAERIELRGTVVDVAGAPIADAMLAIVLPTPATADGVPRQWLTFSATDGTFAFTAVPGLAAARLLTQHPGMLADDRELPTRAPLGVQVQLHAEHRREPVRGTVYGPDGMPLANAMARLGDATARSDESGAFLLAPTASTSPGTPLLVFANGCTPVQLPDPRPGHAGAPAPQTVLLRPAVAIRGRIVDSAGVPLRDWSVTLADPTLLRVDATGASVESHLGGVRVVTDADGAFRFGNVFDRAYTLEAWAFQGGGVLRATVSPASGTVTLTAASQPEGARRGVVLDEDGRAVAGAIVGEARPGNGQVHQNSMRFDERATTDGTGRFTLPRSGAALHLLVDGASIVPVRIAIAANAAPEELLTVRVRRRCAVRLPGAAAAAVAVASVDADGTEQTACGEAADRLGVAATAAALVVRRHGVLVGRLPLAGARDLDLCVQVAAAARAGQ